MTTQAVENTDMHRIKDTGRRYTGESRRMSHSERKATWKKWMNSTSGFWISPASNPLGPSVMPSSK